MESRHSRSVSRRSTSPASGAPCSSDPQKSALRQPKITLVTAQRSERQFALTHSATVSTAERKTARSYCTILASVHAGRPYIAQAMWRSLGSSRFHQPSGWPCDPIGEHLIYPSRLYRDQRISRRLALASVSSRSTWQRYVRSISRCTAATRGCVYCIASAPSAYPVARSRS